MTRPLALDLDGVLGDTRPLWRDWTETASPLLGFDAGELPDDRAEAAARLDELGAGNWRTLLERFAEDRIPLYLRRDAPTGSALRALAATTELGVFTDAPEALARVALAHLGADRRVIAVEAGAGALKRLLATLGQDALVIRSRQELLAASPPALEPHS